MIIALIIYANFNCILTATSTAGSQIHQSTPITSTSPSGTFPSASSHGTTFHSPNDSYATQGYGIHTQQGVSGYNPYSQSGIPYGHQGYGSRMTGLGYQGYGYQGYGSYSPYMSGSPMTQALVHQLMSQTGIPYFDQLSPALRGLVIQSVMDRVYSPSATGTGTTGTGVLDSVASGVKSGIVSAAGGAYGAGSAIAAGAGGALAYAGSGIASAAGTAWAAVSQGALAAGTIGTLSLPIAAATLATGYLGYRAYKWFKGKNKEEASRPLITQPTIASQEQSSRYASPTAFQQGPFEFPFTQPMAQRQYPNFNYLEQ